jgi:hypothetical protein
MLDPKLIKPWSILIHSGALIDGSDLPKEFCWASAKHSSYPYFEWQHKIYDTKSADYICDVEEIKAVRYPPPYNDHICSLICSSCNQFHPFKNCNENSNPTN